MSDTLPATVETVVEQPMDFTVFANNPADMVRAQKSIILWCARKIQAEKVELAEAKRNHDAAKAHKWAHTSWATQVKKEEKRIEFYRKIKMALEAGYYIVPPFPIDIFAIRTKRNWPHHYDRHSPDNHDQPAQLLPAGEGRYVDPKPSRRSFQTQEGVKKDGSQNMVTYFRADDYQPVDFPFKLARSEIREATDAALGLKIFDRLGVLPRQRAPDPIVCGEILLPNQPSYAYSRFGTPKSVLFFVAWWLDTKTL